jgi:hypothetical protein
MSGLRRICRMYGSMEIQGVMWVWDYVKEEAVKKSEQTKEEWAASERRKYALIAEGQAEGTQNEKPF